jgi:NAD(P)-dependent dehydrogenase (short-subunit alcohol dehydrogenase family)
MGHAVERAVVAGGTGAVGEGIVRTLAGAGVTVLVPARSREKLDRLRDRLHASAAARVHGDVVALDDVAAVEAWRDGVVREHGPIDAVVASLGGWWQGEPLARLDEATWRKVLDDGLHAHFRFARAMVPHLAARPTSYTFVNGFSARAPYPLAGPVSVSAAAQLMLAQVLAAEHQEAPLRVNALVLGPVITRVRPSGQTGWITADDVGRIALAVARGDARGEVVSVLNLGELDAALTRFRAGGG